MGADASANKAQRWHRITHALHSHPVGLTVAELSRLCGVTRRTIQRDLRELAEARAPVLSTGDPPRYAMTDGYYIPPAMLSLRDAMSLCWAGLVMASSHPGIDPHISVALRAIAAVLPDEIARHLQERLRDLPVEPDADRQSAVLTNLALGWALRRGVRVEVRDAEDGALHNAVLCPYYVEPSTAHEAALVYGCTADGKPVQGLSAATIMHAELTSAPFVPA